MVKKLLLLLLMPFCITACSATNPVPATNIISSTSAAITYSIKPNATLSPSPCPSLDPSSTPPSAAEFSLEPVSGRPTILVPYSPSDYSNPLPIGYSEIEHDGFFYYVNNGSIYKFNESTETSSLVTRKIKPISNLFFCGDNNLYYTIDGKPEEDGSVPQNLYRHSNGKEHLIIRDVGYINYVTNDYIYYESETHLFRYNIHSGLTENFFQLRNNNENNLSLSMLNITERFLYYTDNDSPQLCYALNMQTGKTYQIFSNTMHWVDSVTDNPYYILGFAGNGNKPNSILFDTSSNQYTQYSFPISNGLNIYPFIVHDGCLLYICYSPDTKTSTLYGFNMKSGEQLVRKDFNGSIRDAVEAQNQWFLYFETGNGTYGSLNVYDFSDNSIHLMKEFINQPDRKRITSMAVAGGYLWEFTTIERNYVSHQILLTKIPLEK